MRLPAWTLVEGWMRRGLSAPPRLSRIPKGVSRRTVCGMLTTSLAVSAIAEATGQARAGAFFQFQQPSAIPVLQPAAAWVGNDGSATDFSAAPSNENVFGQSGLSISADANGYGTFALLGSTKTCRSNPQLPFDVNNNPRLFGVSPIGAVAA